MQMRLSDLARLSAPELKKALSDMEKSNRPSVAETRIQEFESRYEIRSDELLEQLRSGARKETAEIAEWLFWLDTRPNLVTQ